MSVNLLSTQHSLPGFLFLYFLFLHNAKYNTNTHTKLYFIAGAGEFRKIDRKTLKMPSHRIETYLHASF